MSYGPRSSYCGASAPPLVSSPRMMYHFGIHIVASEMVGLIYYKPIRKDNFYYIIVKVHLLKLHHLE